MWRKIFSAIVIAAMLTVLALMPVISRSQHEHDFSYVLDCLTLQCDECDATMQRSEPKHFFVQLDCKTSQCSFCGYTKEGPSTHDAKCTPYICETCGKEVTETHEYVHDYISIPQDSCHILTQCRLCKETHTFDRHEFDHSKQDPCATSRTCTVCQESVPISPYHKWVRIGCETHPRCINCGTYAENFSKHSYQSRLFGGLTYCCYCGDHTFVPENINWFSVIYFSCALAIFVVIAIFAIRHRDTCNKADWAKKSLFFIESISDASNTCTRHYSVGVTLAHSLNVIKEESKPPQD